MKKRIPITLTLVATFGLGFAFKSLITQITNDQPPLKKVTGIGGIFFKCKDPKKMREWYKTNLGLNTNQYGAVFEWRQGADTTKKGFTQWSPFSEKTKYFEPSTKDFMINYRVENLEGLIDQLRKDSVTIVDKIETVEYGKFVHIMDIEGNKLELWEPNDIVYEKLGEKMGSKTTK
jgi:predicted enzyme related to lactoylglutathione lyase